MSLLEKLAQKQNFKKLDGFGYLYADQPFDDLFGGMRSGELVVVASGPNQGKTTFVYKILERNKLSGACMINFEFDMEQNFVYEYFRALGYPPSKIKLLGTDKAPISERERLGLASYIKKRKEGVDVYNMKQGSKLGEVKKKVQELMLQGYTMIAIDSFGSIGDASTSLDEQVKVMQYFRDLCTDTGLCIILIHHFSKYGGTYSGSAKIKDLANTMIQIHSLRDADDNPYRLFELVKDKGFSEVVQAHVYFEKGSYVLVDEFDQGIKQ